MKKIIIVCGIISAVLLSGCVMNKLNTEPQTVVLKDAGNGKNLIIEVSTDGQWSSRMKAGPLIFNILPQAVFWIEDQNGRLIETLYVTGADFKKMRHAAKNADGELFYAECLPYWASRVKAAGGKLPSKENPYPDTVTSATPMADFTLKTGISVDPSFVIMAEFNKSGDYNSVYTEDNSGWTGQPSLIYKADAGNKDAGKYISLKTDRSRRKLE